MKRTAIVLASLLTVACSSAHKTDSSHVSQMNENRGASASSVTTGADASVAVDLSSLNAEIQRLQQQSDYFDFDKSAIKPKYRAIIQKQAEFIKAHKNDVVTLEGNADERGSERYNLALGNRRAEAVFEALVNLGVPAAQIKTVSFGKDKPRLSCHKEKCWKENRRVDFEHRLI